MLLVQTRHIVFIPGPVTFQRSQNFATKWPSIKPARILFINSTIEFETPCLLRYIVMTSTSAHSEVAIPTFLLHGQREKMYGSLPVVTCKPCRIFWRMKLCRLALLFPRRGGAGQRGHAAAAPLLGVWHPGPLPSRGTWPWRRAERLPLFFCGGGSRGWVVRLFARGKCTYKSAPLDISQVWQEYRTQEIRSPNTIN